MTSLRTTTCDLLLLHLHTEFLVLLYCAIAVLLRDETIQSPHDMICIDMKGDNLVIYDMIQVVKIQTVTIFTIFFYDHIEDEHNRGMLKTMWQSSGFRWLRVSGSYQDLLGWATIGLIDTSRYRLIPSFTVVSQHKLPVVFLGAPVQAYRRPVSQGLPKNNQPISEQYNSHWCYNLRMSC